MREPVPSMGLESGQLSFTKIMVSLGQENSFKT